MKLSKFQAPKGVSEYFPPDSNQFEYVRDHLLQSAKLAGYNLIELPVFEDTEVFTRGVGESGQAEILMINVNKDGYIDLEQMDSVIKERHEEIALISVMHSNNEVGTIQPIKEIAKLAFFSMNQISLMSILDALFIT